MFCRRAALALLLAACVVGSGCAPKARSKMDFALDTMITLTVYGGSDALLSECFELIGSYERLWSRTMTESDISRANIAGIDGATIDAKTGELIAHALAFSEASGGAFDITIGAASALWDFKNERIPDENALGAAVKSVGWRNVSLEKGRVALKNGAQLDLGAIAKGAITDELANFLRSRGVRSAVMNLGGNVYALGSRPDGTPFSIGLRSPFGEGLFAKLSLMDMSIVTSGVYERGFDAGGRRYHHLLDPKTGRPADNGLVSVSIIAENSAKADALSTACFVLGLERGMELAKSEGVEAIFVLDGGEVRSTPGVEALGFTLEED